MPKTLMCAPCLTERDLRSRIYIVTGASSVAALATAKQLASQGAHIVGACRRVEAGKQAFAAMGPGRRSTEEMELDLASLASLRRL